MSVRSWFQRGSRALHKAIESEDVASLVTTLRRGGDVNKRYRRGQRRYTALHLAAAKGNASFARLLISYGADVDARTTEDETSLDIALKHNNSAVAKLLSDEGAKVSPKAEADAMATRHGFSATQPDIVVSQEEIDLWHKALTSDDPFLKRIRSGAPEDHSMMARSK